VRFNDNYSKTLYDQLKRRREVAGGCFGIHGDGEGGGDDVPIELMRMIR